MDIGLPPDERDGINIEFCSGYTDNSGQWNSGFYCPNDGDSEALFCCGSSSYKYCCSVNRDLVEDDTFKSWYIIVGFVLGVSLAIVFTIAVCRICCYAYKKDKVTHNNKTNKINDGLFQAQETSLSTTIGVANMYSFSNHQHPQQVVPQDGDNSTTTRAVSELILELESQTVLNKSFSFSGPNTQIISRPGATELCLPNKISTQPVNSALNFNLLTGETSRSASNGMMVHTADTDALYRSTKF